jgi:hypothetical protein
MATTTPNFGWAVPTSTDLVKDGAVAIETLGDSIDASLVDLKGGTTGQVLAKASNTDMDFSWVAQDDSNAIQNSLLTTTGDTIYASGASTPARLGIGSNGQVLTVASGVPSWATPAAGSSGLTKIVTATFSNVADTGTTFDGCFTSTYDNYVILFSGLYASAGSSFRFQTRLSGSTQATSNYNGSYTRGATVTATSSGTSFNLMSLQDVSTQQGAMDMTFYRNTSKISWTYLANGRGSADVNYNGAGFNDNVSANGSDGFILSANTANIYGTVTVYGVQK